MPLPVKVQFTRHSRVCLPELQVLDNREDAHDLDVDAVEIVIFAIVLANARAKHEAVVVDADDAHVTEIAMMRALRPQHFLAFINLSVSFEFTVIVVLHTFKAIAKAKLIVQLVQDLVVYVIRALVCITIHLLILILLAVNFSCNAITE